MVRKTITVAQIERAVDVNLIYAARCGSCSGSGACSSCGGSGRNGRYHCPPCGGSGSCGACGGVGLR